YEGAWIASLPIEALDQLQYKIYGILGTGIDLRRKLLTALVQEQHDRGYWGSSFSNGDQLLQTAAAVYALATALADDPLYDYSFRRGADFLLNAPPYDPENDLADLAGIELILPALSSRLEKYNLSLNFSPNLLEKSK